MRPTRSVGQLAVIFLSLSPAVSAWASWPRWLPELDTLVVRQDKTSPASPSPTPSASAAPKTSAGDESTTTRKVISTNLNTGGRTVSGIPTETGTGARNGTKTRTKGSKHTMFDPQSPAGGVVMMTPAITEGTQLYKIGDYITLGWNYTHLLAQPTAVDVLVSNSRASQTWTLTQNMTFATKGSYTWDTHEYSQTAIASPLLVDQYTLLIYDSDGSVTATPEAGYLAPFSGFVFGLYTPQAYTPLSDWQCPTCSGAMSDVERRALGGAVIMSIITVLSFTWFVGGFGALL